MTKLAQTLGLTEFQTEIVAAVRQFVDREVIPAAQELIYRALVIPAVRREPPERARGGASGRGSRSDEASRRAPDPSDRRGR